MLQGEDIMKSVKDRLFKRIWTVLLALMITVSFTPAVIFSESGADGAGQPAQTEQAGVKDGGGSTEKETAVEVASKDGDTDSDKGKKTIKQSFLKRKKIIKKKLKKKKILKQKKQKKQERQARPSHQKLKFLKLHLNVLIRQGMLRLLRSALLQ